MELTTALINHFWSNSSSICLLLDKNNRIEQANNFAIEITGSSLIGQIFHEIIVDFKENISIRELIGKSDKKILLNITTTTGLPSTFYFNFYELTDKSILAVGEANSIEIELMRKTLFEVNSDLNAMTRKLHKSNSELIKLNEAKNRFLGIAAHDLRSPIGNILNFSQLLREQIEEKINPSQIKILEIIESSSEFLLNLLNELLDISSIESGRVKITKELTDLEELITNNISENRVSSEKKEIQIYFNLLNNVPKINVDKSKINQVLNNLINNAIKFSFPNHTIHITLASNKTEVNISIRDQGQGIPFDELKTVFEPFTTTSTKSTNNERSTGLGLSIVSNIIKAHDGRIWVESTLGVGSTFHIILPIN